MKKILRFSKLMVLLLSVSIAAMGQYTGTNLNIAAFKKTLASDSVAINVPARAVDTLLTTYASIPGVAPAWIQVDLGTFYFIDGYGLVLQNAGELPLAYTLQGSPDGLSWLNLGNGTSPATGTYGYNLAFPDVFRFIRLRITSKDALASITEFRVFGYQIFPPNPPLANAATNVTASGFRANWGPISGAEGYLLDVSTNINFSTYLPGYEEYDAGYAFSHNITGLTHSSTYYYRVKAYNAAGKSSGSNKITVTTLKQSQTIVFDLLPAGTYGGDPFDLAATASSGLPVAFASSDDGVATVSGTTVTITGIGTASITASQAGNAQYLAAVPVSRDLVVNPKELTVTGVTAADKVYDGTVDAILSGGALVGVVGTDSVSLADTTGGIFAQGGAGNGIDVTTSLILMGPDSLNYTLVQPAGITANITPKELSITGVTAEDKVYDGTTSAVVTGGILDGVIGDDVVTLTGASTGTFAQSDVGASISVSTTMAIGGADAGNYTVTQPGGITADITQKELTVTADDATREECATNPDFGVSYSGFVGSENESVIDAEPVASSAADEGSPAGGYDITPSGGSDGNYSFAYVAGTLTVTADATAPVLTTKPVTIQLDDSGNATLKPSDVVESATDNCTLADTTLSKSEFTSGDVGEAVIEVTLTDQAGNSAKEFAVVTIEGSTGIRDLSDVLGSLHPNPTSGRVEMELNARADMLKVMDITGKTILTRSNLQVQETVDLSGYNNGIYIFQLQVGDALFHVKVIKK